MKPKLNMEKITAALGGERMGKVSATGGFFGATQLVLDIKSQFQVPAGGGRATDPNWTERRLIKLAPEALEQLRELAEEVSEHQHIHLHPMQLAAFLLHQTLEKLTKKQGRLVLKPE